MKPKEKFELKPSTRSEDALIPVTRSGVIAPWRAGYKLLSHGGAEYFIVHDPRWRDILSRYCWDEVKVAGLLNVSNRTLFLQKIFPKDPTGIVKRTGENLLPAVA